MMAILMVSRYNIVESEFNKNKKNPFETKEFASDIYYSNYYLYYKSYQMERNRLIKPSDLFLSDDTIETMIDNMDTEYYSSSIDSEKIKTSFNNAFNKLGKFLYKSDGNIKFHSENIESGFSISNFGFRNDMKTILNYNKYILSGESDFVDGKNKSLENESIKKEKIVKEYNEFQKDIKSNFLTYLVIEFDSLGKYNLLYCHGINKDMINNYLLELDAGKNLNEVYSMTDENATDFSNYKVESIKNMRYTFAIPNSILNNVYSKNDSISEYINKSERNYFASIEKLARIIILIIAMGAFLLSVEMIRKFRFIKTLMMLPFEFILGITFFLYYSIFNDDISIRMVRETITGNLLKIVINNGIPKELANYSVLLINIGYWFILFIVAFAIVCMIKIIVETSISEYFKNKSLIISFANFVYKNVSKLIYKTLNVDLSKRYNRLFFIGIIIIITGAVILPIIDISDILLWLLLTLLYIVVITIYIKVVSKEIKRGKADYEELLILTKDIADGNLDKDIMNVDTGIYDEIKLQLYHIQQAYKKSIEEEIKSQRMKSELISNISHDLKTPLTSIISYADILKYMETSEETSRYIDTIYRKSERLRVLIDDMFEISKAQTGNIKLEFNQIDIVRLMEQSIFELKDRLVQRRITLKTKFPKEKTILYLDGEKTYRIFENLIVNIAKYALENSRAYIEIVDKGDNVEIIFKNISETEIDYEVQDIMERFKRGDKSRSSEGFGLGISIAKSYIEAQGGTLDVFLDGDLFKSVVTFPKEIKFDEDEKQN